ncbi:isoprenyl transferase [Ornithobacterium rhinotracheale]|uniref:Isoprenyl transferase n=2 Tax=Ornithobacterium rhinotracheale TaxID=28251 RepID=I3ZYU0_ORNRL|nr:isoprenyl transferase [Ornithobacterium rhinotracheale]AFL96874.1 undecaprenyl diphosphate synthase [Ornithobacterium rhinotracheale DSM 15997]MCK0194597.1 isoprenyl transferase [Ornithobacterium rhinotracheale]MCK0200307.1 isoprenyl transferase [Ornithobacterium rhinotracheale]MCK0202799.1 isoprenyl transferase [Ornithobacterium rhinotracheale]MCK0205011.1 isoprenyl transferase [Ornithobacterium rhinotracheale]
MSKSLLQNINLDNVPQHVAVIMDGNGRWAQKKGMMRTFGHQSAVKAVRQTIKACEDLGVPYLTLYAFSSENWNRPKEEVSFLMNLLFKTLTKELKSFQENNIRLRTIGDLSRVPEKARKELLLVEEETKNNTKATLTLALSYGGRDEIVEATQKIAKAVQENKLSIDQINHETFKNYLYSPDIPDVDLVIRTSGECRISNFLLWQIAYAELYFTEVLWPDFRKEDFYEAIINYQNRQRRFGKTGEQIK